KKPIPPPPPPLSQQFGTAPGGMEPPPAQSAGNPSGAEVGIDRGIAPGITGEIQIKPELVSQIHEHAVLFIIARKAGGPPVAARKIENPTFPLRFFIGQESVMMQGQSMEGKIDLSARIAQHGAAGPAQPGDISGACPDNPISVGNSSVFSIVLDTVN
ncbi:MAG: hypothetical protein KC729_11495, partial [Candidatus Eisenbacteria bacterium]|nr:hypothetical protein [Candidatus Eisenbacteria bacterium]